MVTFKMHSECMNTIKSSRTILLSTANFAFLHCSDTMSKLKMVYKAVNCGGIGSTSAQKAKVAHTDSMCVQPGTKLTK